MTDVLHSVQGVGPHLSRHFCGFPQFSLIAQPTTIIPPLQTRPTPLHTMHASVFVSGPSPGLVFQPTSSSLSLTLSVHYKYTSSPTRPTPLHTMHASVFVSGPSSGSVFQPTSPSLSLTLSTHYKYTPSQTWPTPLHIMHASVLVSGPPYSLLARFSIPAAPLSFRSPSAPNPHSMNLNV